MQARPLPDIPSALTGFDAVADALNGRRAAVFLDYDGTLTPIVDRPELAVLDDAMRRSLDALSRRFPVSVISGRDRADVERLVGLESIAFAGSHGFDIATADGRHLEYPEADGFTAMLREAEDRLRTRVETIDGVLVEGKKYAVAVHYRQVAPEEVDAVKQAVDAVAADFPHLRKTGGKKVVELRPRLDWDKGKALRWLLSALDLDSPDVLPLYLGDDVTDEDAFAALEGSGIAILVADSPRATRANYRLDDPGQVKTFLDRLTALPDGGGQ